MDQHGSSGSSDSDSSGGSSDHSQTRVVEASTSDTPPRTSASSHFYTHPARTSILSPSGGLLLDQIPGLASVTPRADNNGMNDMDSFPAENVWREGGSLPSFSRGFNMYMAPLSSNGAKQGADDGFFVPSYLAASTYVRKLKEAHKSKVRGQKETQKEVKASSANGTDSHETTTFAHQSLPTSGSHQGLAHTIVERPPPFEEDDSMAPLPTRWNKDDLWGGIEVRADGRSVKYTGSKNSHERDHEASAVRADHYMPPQCGIYYYEVAIIHGKRDDTTIAIGFATKNASISRPVGWEAESWGYHGDDGRCFTGQNIGRPFGSPFNTGDVIGCGVNFRDHTAFFTKNGVKINGVAFHDVARGKLYPAVSLKKPGEQIEVNFGQAPFVFDIDDMMTEQRNQIRSIIEKTDVSGLEPGLGESDLVQALVLQFLQHDGYVETARIFAEDIRKEKKAMTLNPNVDDVDGISIKDDDDANNRQRIRRAILGGDIDHALKLTNAFYPQVFKEYEEVHFRLRCRKFIEIVRSAAQYRFEAETRKSNGHGPGSASMAQEMDVDFMAGDGPPFAPNNVAEAESQAQKSDLSSLEAEMLHYGQTLSAEYADDQRKEVIKALEEIWALVAYTNPTLEPQIRHLLDKSGRITVAEELNSAILSSLGKSSRASLEKVYAQTSVLLEDLRTDGGSGAFISVQDVVDSITAYPLLSTD